MGEETRPRIANLVRLLHISDAEIIARPYGRLYLLSARNAGLANLQMLLMVIEPGARTSNHLHPSEEIFFVLSGHALFKSHNLSQRLESQDTMIVPAGEPHQIENLSTMEPCEMLIALSPPRNPELVIYC